MKKILITGKNSYVGNSFEKWLENYPTQYEVDKMSLRDETWKKNDFSKYDVILHVAGIAHRKENKENKDIYYKVNRDLAYEVANKAKKDGVSHFVFLSSMSVYGLKTGVITSETTPNPISDYGKSKLEAEKLFATLNDHLFKITILRPPMIYGKACKGNYMRLSKLAKRFPVFPNIKNKRSMIFIDNLSELIKKIIDNTKSGYYFPQNDEYVNTSRLVEEIAASHNKKIYFTKIFNPLIQILNIQTINKVFGNLTYDKSLSHNIEIEYIVVDFEKSIRATEE